MKQQTKRKRKNRLPNGSIPIKHFIFDNIFAKGKLTKRELQIISVIIRDSWGYKSITNNGNWTKDSLRNEDFVKRTGISKSHISKQLKTLIRQKVIFKKEGKYSFNKDYQYWKFRKPTKRIKKNKTNRYLKKIIPSPLRWQVWERDNFTCQNKTCRSRKNLTVDHIVPESKGGKTKLSNLQTLCKKCNSKKGIKID